MIIKRKELAAKALKVGKDRIKFVNARLDEIKEAITKQDIKDLVVSGAILIKPVKGRRANIKRKHRRGTGEIRKKVKGRKQEYVKITRKLRAHVKLMRKSGVLTREKAKEIRKEIRNRTFKSKSSLKLNIEEKSKK